MWQLRTDTDKETKMTRLSLCCLCSQRITLQWGKWSCWPQLQVGTLTCTSARWEWATAGREHWQQTDRHGRRAPNCSWSYAQGWGPKINEPPWTERRRWRTGSRQQTQLACKRYSCRQPLGTRPEPSECLGTQGRAFWAEALRSMLGFLGDCEPDNPEPEFDGDTRGNRFSILSPHGSAACPGTPDRRCVNSPVVWECVGPGRSSCSIFCTRTPRRGSCLSSLTRQSHGRLQFRPPPPCSA